jgi:hypothetical protein
MDLESFLGNRMSFERCRSAIEDARDRLSPSMSVDYHYKVGTGLARFGQVVRAREALEIGLRTAESHQLNAWYFKIEQAIASISASEHSGGGARIASNLSQEAVVHQVVVGLREYAEAGAL